MASESIPTISSYSSILLHDLPGTEPSDVSMLELCGLGGGELGEPKDMTGRLKYWVGVSQANQKMTVHLKHWVGVSQNMMACLKYWVGVS